MSQVPGIKQEIDAGRLCAIGLVLVHSVWPWDVAKNHVVLVYGYDQNGSILRLHTYDCNYPGRDDIYIDIDATAPAPVRPILTNGTDEVANPGHIRGFYCLPSYSHSDPQGVYVDAANYGSMQVPTYIAPGGNDRAHVRMVNTGSTTWGPGRGYKLVENQAVNPTTPTWGPAVAAGGTQPGLRADFDIPMTAPMAPGTYEAGWILSGAEWKRAGDTGSIGVRRGHL